MARIVRAVSTTTQLLQTPYTSWLYGTPVTPTLLRLDPLWDPFAQQSSFPKTLRGKAALNPLKSWEIIAGNFSKAGWSWGRISSADQKRRQFWVAAERDNARRFIVRADEKLTAFVELESVMP
ncbi:MAG TPA: hypothetical protein VKE29_01970 [Candidatus Udaeobacter sp.]|nr:hypothetical protein [Candidatus Udaeobacter sp.]